MGTVLWVLWCWRHRRALAIRHWRRQHLDERSFRWIYEPDAYFADRKDDHHE